MSSLLITHAEPLVTMDDADTEIADGALYVENGVIVAVGKTADLPETADVVVDLRGHVVAPGLVNTHHHLYQSLTRAIPGAQDADLFTWLRTLYPIWARLTPEAVRVSTQVGLAELARSGCTTAADHLYLFPGGARLDDEIDAAREVGLRLHASRGSMSLGQSKGGLPPDSVVEDEAAILRDTRRLIETWHDAADGAMTRIVVAPCSPFSVTEGLMTEAARLARAYGVRLHTHLAETIDEEAFCLATSGLRPVAYMARLDWVGPDVWFAHAVHVRKDEIPALAGAGVAHCPSSNMRLASGIAPVEAFLAKGVPVGLGVDGSASNDGGHLLAEARQAMLLARLATALRRADPDAPARLMPARTALRMATRGGASVLGRTDIGSLEAGKRADFFAIDSGRLAYAGSGHDPVAALLLCAPQEVDLTVVEGRIVVRNRRLETVDEEHLVARHTELARAMGSMA
jgi:8-oxoguanine deaminase